MSKTHNDYVVTKPIRTEDCRESMIVLVTKFYRHGLGSEEDYKLQTGCITWSDGEGTNHH